MSLVILEDSRQQSGKHDLKHEYFNANGIEVRRTKLYVGDYTLPANQSVCIDTKYGVQELISDVCGKQHERFRNELIRAQEAGIKLIILVEHEPSYADKAHKVWNGQIDSLQDLFYWRNPRLFIFRSGQQAYPRATRGKTIAKACMTLQAKYGCEFRFCKPEAAGRRIIEILTEGNNAETD